MKFNINDKVQIKLTSYGVKFLKANDADPCTNNLDNNTNILNEQLWVVMSIFGEEMHNGGQQLFAGNIIELFGGE